MTQPSFKDAITICKSIMRNGFDAHVVNTQLQHDLIIALHDVAIDLATDAPCDELAKIFPNLIRAEDKDAPGLMALLRENEAMYRFYCMNIADASLPDSSLTRLTPTILSRMRKLGPLPGSLVSGMTSLAPSCSKSSQGFDDFSKKEIKLEGLPEETLRSDYLLSIRAFRHAANYDLPIEPNTWMSIVRSSQSILDYVPIQQIMEEWRKVAAENMWRFVQMLFDSQIMHGILPEIAGLARVRQTKNDSGVEETVLEHSINCVRYYPEGEFHHDWYGTFAMLFHDVGKLYTAEHYQGRWTFYEHHRVGAKITRKILRRLHMLPEDIELICHLVRNHMRFQFMMTDKGIRRFRAQDEYPRLIEMSRANIKAREDNYTAFNHNTKYLERAEMPEQMLEPLLNGNEIMEFTGLSPGPLVGHIRHALLTAQITGEVTTREEAIAFARTCIESRK
ncbi:MAG: HD domain-containing protein [Desulfovibrio sp.]|jgi:poly(A) polymerase|nr:HD domain-containing protein [Desulfovibrio sp.]